jgi:3-oxoadipate enol-lactonase
MHQGPGSCAVQALSEVLHHLLFCPLRHSIGYTVRVFFYSDGSKLFYTTVGGGPAVVLLHPTPVDHRFWMPVAEILAEKYRVIVPDLRGHGQSELGEGPITVEKLAADAGRLLDHLEIGKALLGGCSIGGYTLFEIWRTMPARVEAFAFCCSRAQSDNDAARAKREQTIAKVREQGTAEFIESNLETLIGSAARRRWPEKVAEAREMMQAVPVESIVAVQQGLATRPDSVVTARTMRVPCCVIAGGEDPASPPADMKLLAEQIRNGGYGAEYSEIPDAGHFAPFEQPELVGRILRRFFDSVI